MNVNHHKHCEGCLFCYSDHHGRDFCQYPGRHDTWDYCGGKFHLTWEETQKLPNALVSKEEGMWVVRDEATGELLYTTAISKHCLNAGAVEQMCWAMGYQEKRVVSA